MEVRYPVEGHLEVNFWQFLEIRYPVVGHLEVNFWQSIIIADL